MIYHLVKESTWDTFKHKVHYSTHSLSREGFIHCSYRDQLLKVANTLYRGSNDLLVLCINEDKVEHILKVEDLYKLDENYPHLYGELPINAVEKVVKIELLKDGTFKEPNLNPLSSLEVEEKEWT